MIWIQIFKEWVTESNLLEWQMPLLVQLHNTDNLLDKLLVVQQLLLLLEGLQLLWIGTLLQQSLPPSPGYPTDSKLASFRVRVPQINTFTPVRFSHQISNNIRCSNQKYHQHHQYTTVHHLSMKVHCANWSEPSTGIQATLQSHVHKISSNHSPWLRQLNKHFGIECVHSCRRQVLCHSHF